jgi:hypothetical protein
MKTFAQKIQEAAQKAIRMKQAVEGAPLKVAEFRHALQQTTQELQGIGQDVQSTISGLKLTDPSGLPEAVHQITAAAAVLREAGYEVSGFEMEMGPIHRLVLLLDRAQAVPLPLLSSLVQRHAGEAILQGLLEAVLEAETMVVGLELPKLSYRRLRIHLGAIPTIRLIWDADENASANTTSRFVAGHGSGVLPSSMTGSVQTTTPNIPTYGQSSFFERRPTAAPSSPPPLPSAGVPPHPEDPAPAANPAAIPPPQPHSYSKDWGRGALDRFKKMPTLGSENR